MFPHISGLLYLIPVMCSQHHLCSRPVSCDHGSVLPDPDDCQAYFECTVRRRWEQQRCSNSQRFDVVQMACIKKNQARCLDCSFTTPSVVDETAACSPPVPCVLDSVLGNPDSCASYQMCFTERNWRVFDCPDGQLFDILSSQCVDSNQEEYICQPSCDLVTLRIDPNDRNNPNPNVASTSPSIRTVEPDILDTACGIVEGENCSIMNHAFPDVNDCEYFYLCIGIWLRIRCADVPDNDGHDYYDGVSGQCRTIDMELTCATPCSTTAVPTTTTSPAPTIDPVILERACSVSDGDPCTVLAEYLPNPTDCGSFYFCLITTWEVISCTNGNHFDALSDDICKNPDLALCAPPCPTEPIPTTTSSPSTSIVISAVTSTTTETSTDPSTTTSPAPTIDPVILERACSVSYGDPCTVNADLLPNPTDCGSFYFCSITTWLVISCTNGNHFDALSDNVCKDPDLALCAPPCPTEPIPTTTSSPSTSIIISAVTSTTTETSTAPSTTTSPAPSIDPVILERACSVSYGDPCTANAEYLPNPTDCGSFYFCSITTWLVIPCTNGNHFDALSDNVCKDPDLALCAPPCPTEPIPTTTSSPSTSIIISTVTSTTTETSTAPSTTTSPAPTIDPVILERACSVSYGDPCTVNADLLPNPTDCGSFYFCSITTWLVIPCTNGNHFDALSDNVCKDPDLALCAPPCPTEPIPTTTSSPSTSIIISAVTSTTTETSTAPSTTTSPAPSIDPVILERACSVSYGDPCTVNAEYLPNPTDCGSFYFCSITTWLVIPCTNGNHFDALSDNVCKDPDLALCAPPCPTEPIPTTTSSPSTSIIISTVTSTTTETSTDPSTTTSPAPTIDPVILERACSVSYGDPCTVNADLLPNPTDCGSFYFCSITTWIVISCTNGNHFDALSDNICKDPDLALCAPPCPTEPIPTTTSSPSTSIIISAVTSTTTETSTAPSTTTSPAPSIDPVILERACSVSYGDPCTVNAEYLPNPTDCGSFYFCSITTWIVISCTNGDHFDALSDNICKDSDLALCAPPCPTEPIPTTTSSPSTSTITSTVTSTTTETTTHYPHISHSPTTMQGIIHAQTEELKTTTLQSPTTFPEMSTVQSINQTPITQPSTPPVPTSTTDRSLLTTPTTTIPSTTQPSPPTLPTSNVVTTPPIVNPTVPRITTQPSTPPIPPSPTTPPIVTLSAVPRFTTQSSTPSQPTTRTTVTSSTTIPSTTSTTTQPLAPAETVPTTTTTPHSSNFPQTTFPSTSMESSTTQSPTTTLPSTSTASITTSETTESSTTQSPTTTSPSTLTASITTRETTQSSTTVIYISEDPTTSETPPTTIPPTSHEPSTTNIVTITPTDQITSVPPEVTTSGARSSEDPVTSPTTTEQYLFTTTLSGGEETSPTSYSSAWPELTAESSTASATVTSDSHYLSEYITTAVVANASQYISFSTTNDMNKTLYEHTTEATTIGDDVSMGLEVDQSATTNGNAPSTESPTVTTSGLLTTQPSVVTDVQSRESSPTATKLQLTTSPSTSK